MPSCKQSHTIKGHLLEYTDPNGYRTRTAMLNSARLCRHSHIFHPFKTIHFPFSKGLASFWGINQRENGYCDKRFSFKKIVVELGILLIRYYPLDIKALFTVCSTTLMTWLCSCDCRFRATKHETLILDENGDLFLEVFKNSSVGVYLWPGVCRE